jgi:hypothetical protein
VKLGECKTKEEVAEWLEMNPVKRVLSFEEWQVSWLEKEFQFVDMAARERPEENTPDYEWLARKTLIALKVQEPNPWDK